MGQLDLIPCIELVVIETRVVCSENANKIPMRGNFPHGWLPSRRKEKLFVHLAFTASFFWAVAAGSNIAFTIGTAFCCSPHPATVSQVLL